MATSGDWQGTKRLNSVGLECPICLKVYKDPRSLACLHTFCLECLDALVLKAKEEGKLGDGIDCPICRTRTKMTNKNKIPEEWSKDLTPNYTLIAALQIMNKGSEMDRTLLCQQCLVLNKESKVKAKTFCVSCSQYQCDECVISHKKFSFMTGHKMIDFDKSEAEVSGEVVDFTHLLHCHEHNKVIEVYCTNHGALCCTTCAIVAHKLCENVELHKVDKKVNHEDVKKDMIHMIRRIEWVAAKMTENENEIDSDIANTGERIAAIRKRVFERLKNFETNVQNKMQSRKESVMSANDKIRTDGNRLKVALEGSIGMIDIISIKSSQEAQFVAMDKINQQYQIYKISVDELCDATKMVRMELKVDDSLTRVSDHNDELGEVEFISGSLKAVDKDRALKPIKCIDMKCEGGKREPLITGLGFLSDGRIAMVDNYNSECLVMDDNLVQLTSLKLPYKPTGLTVLTTEEVLITGTGKSIHFYTVREDNVLCEQKQITLDFECDSISQIDNDTYAVSCYNTNIPVCKVTRQGEVSQFEVEFPDKNYKIGQSLCCYSRMNSYLVVTLSDLHEIRVVDTKYKTTTVIKDKTMIKCPSGVVAVNGRSRSFYVCSRGPQSIVHVSFNGLILGNYKLTDLKLPNSIDISADNGKLVVSNAVIGSKKLGLLDRVCQ